MPHIAKIIVAAIIVFLLLVFSRQFQVMFDSKLAEEDTRVQRLD